MSYLAWNVWECLIDAPRLVPVDQVTIGWGDAVSELVSDHILADQRIEVTRPVTEVHVCAIPESVVITGKIGEIIIEIVVVESKVNETEEKLL